MKPKNSIRNIIVRELAIIGFAYLIGALVTLFFNREIFSNPLVFFKNTLWGFAFAYSLSRGNIFISHFIQKAGLWGKNPKKALIISLLSSSIYSLIAIIAVYWFFIDVAYKNDFWAHFGNYWVSILINFIICMMIVSFMHWKYFIKRWQESIQEQEILKQQAIQYKYETLKNQINPHFLFNSLSVLSGLVEADQQKAIQFIKRFSNIYRYVLEQKDKDVVSIDTELTFLNDYISLQKIRYGDELIIKNELNYTKGYAVPLSLQLLVENSLKHNVITAESPLTVSLTEENGYIVVQNNLQIKKVIKDMDGIGLETIKKRYEYLSQKPVFIDNGDKFFTVKVPVLQLNDTK